MVWLLSVTDQPLLPDLVTHNAAEVSKINSFCTFINSVSLIGKHEWDYTADYLLINIFLYGFDIFCWQLMETGVNGLIGQHLMVMMRQELEVVTTQHQAVVEQYAMVKELKQELFNVSK